MKKLVIDLDDTICEGGFLYLINKYLNTNYTKNDFKEYYMQNIIPKEEIDKFYDLFLSNNVYDYAYIIDGAYDVIKSLSIKYDIYVCSAFCSPFSKEESQKLLGDKFNWLQKEFPFIDPNHYIFTSSKDLIKCDIMIDDKLSNLNGDIDNKYMFTAYHNKSLTDEELNNKGVIRVNSWKEIENILM